MTEAEARALAHQLLNRVNQVPSYEICRGAADGRCIPLCDDLTAHILTTHEAHEAEVGRLREHVAAQLADWKMQWNTQFDRADRAETERDALRSQLASVTAELDRLKGACSSFEAERARLLPIERERLDVRYRLQTLVDERFGPEPILSCDKLIDIIEAGITRERLAEDALRVRERVLVEELRNLRRYGDHMPTCGDDLDVEDTHLGCTCGYDATMQDVDAALAATPETTR